MQVEYWAGRGGSTLRLHHKHIRGVIESNTKKNISQDTNIQMLGYTFNLCYVIDYWARLYNSNITCYRYKFCLDYKLLLV